MKLDTRTTTIEIGGETVKVGKLTLGAAIEIEAYLQTIDTPLEIIERSKILAQVDKEVADKILDGHTQDLAFWPPDAIGALCDKRFLTSGRFGKAFVSAIIRAYNAHLDDATVERIANRSTVDTVYLLTPIALLGVNSDPKDAAGVGVADPPNVSSGGG